MNRTKITPKHVLWIPDGNRRYANNTRNTFQEAYYAGGKKCISATRFFLEHGAEEVSVYVTSKDNMKRGCAWNKIIRNTFIKLKPEFEKLSKECSVRFKIISFVQLPEEIAVLNKIQSINDTNETIRVINILYGYSFEEDMNSAIKKLKRKVGLKFTWDDMRKELALNDIDLAVRTSGQMRISDGPMYALGQAYFIEIKHTIAEITEMDLYEVLEKYSSLLTYKQSTRLQTASCLVDKFKTT